MAANKKPRKPYRPKIIRAIPLSYGFTFGTSLKLKLIPHQVLEKFKAGDADEGNWHDLNARILMGKVLTLDYFPDAKPEIDAAIVALHNVWNRHTRTGVWGMSGEDISKIGDGLNLTDHMQSQCTRREVDRAFDQVFAATKRRNQELLAAAAAEATSPCPA